MEIDQEKLYFPVVKGKINDIRAVSLMPGAAASQVMPVFELPPFHPSDSPEAILGRFAARIAQHFGKRSCFVDFPMMKPAQLTSDGTSSLVAAYRELNNYQIPFLPVYGFDRDQSVWPVVASQASHSDGLLLRLVKDDIEFFDETIERIESLKNYGLESGKVHLYMDFRHLGSSIDKTHALELATEFVVQFQSAGLRSTIIVGASCAPKTVAAIQKDSVGEYERLELPLWLELISDTQNLRIRFSDYGVIHPDFSDLTMSTHINGKIRYTAGRKTHVFRGHSLRQGNRYEQYRDLAKGVLGSGLFLGSSYSFGDRYVQDCATGLVGTGNAGTWVLVDQNHHFTYVCNQIRKSLAAVAAGQEVASVLTDIEF